MTPDLNEYLETIAPSLNFPGKREYELNLNLVHSALSDSLFFKGLSAKLRGIADCYAPGKPELLFGPKLHDPDLLVKEYNSCINKTYRENV